MSPNESRWWQTCLAELPAESVSPVVNLGSSTEDYRKNVCPFIDANIFRPLEAKGITVIHADLKAAQGVEIIGDITTKAVQDTIRAKRPRAIFCNNMLEHVTDRRSICSAIEKVLPSGGYALVSVPRAYPYHPDPIDNGFRPSAAELSAEFPSFVVVKQATVEFGNYLGQLLEKPWLFARDGYLIFGGVVSRNRWRVLFSNYKYLFRRYSVTCVLLQRK